MGDFCLADLFLVGLGVEGPATADFLGDDVFAGGFGGEGSFIATFLGVDVLRSVKTKRLIFSSAAFAGDSSGGLESLGDVRAGRGSSSTRFFTGVRGVVMIAPPIGRFVGDCDVEAALVAGLAVGTGTLFSFKGEVVVFSFFSGFGWGSVNVADALRLRRCARELSSFAIRANFDGKDGPPRALLPPAPVFLVRNASMLIWISVQSSVSIFVTAWNSDPRSP